MAYVGSTPEFPCVGFVKCKDREARAGKEIWGQNLGHHALQLAHKITTLLIS